ncbi:DUF302 domain-containing protein [Natrinema salaciae]|uniref:Uncharacterized conserved protein, DUF302 family n=1 Tax=Natrinema salaciae TaxID=1186196 RepID=A0A1H9QDU6_9EURY|nr:DUF302 domain-containing protein [Natrinema salaciae]SER58580.1 Uncharacterized conserved protein, DUF302 family [Natrinema salaciae]
MTRDSDGTARRRFVQLLGASTAAGTGVSTTAAAAGASARTAQTDDGSAADGTDSGLVTVESNANFETTVSRVEAVLEASGVALLTTVDHAANAASVEQSLPPTTLFLFGNPAAGTPLMQAERSVAIDLPQKLLVWEDGGDVFLTYNDPQYLAARHGLDAADEQLAMVGEALQQLVAAIAGGE